MAAAHPRPPRPARPCLRLALTPCPPGPAPLPQDVHSRSFVVRFYYRNRIFMGFCCVCCEVRSVHSTAEHSTLQHMRLGARLRWGLRAAAGARQRHQQPGVYGVRELEPVS